MPKAYVSTSTGRFTGKVIRYRGEGIAGACKSLARRVGATGWAIFPEPNPDCYQVQFEDRSGLIFDARFVLL